MVAMVAMRSLGTMGTMTGVGPLLEKQKKNFAKHFYVLEKKNGICQTRLHFNKKQKSQPCLHYKILKTKTENVSVAKRPLRV